VDNKQTVERFVEQIINNGDLGPVVDEMFALEYIEGNYPLDNMTGPESVRTWVPYLHYMLPDVRHEILDIFEDDDMVICRSIQVGTPRRYFDNGTEEERKRRRTKRMEINLLRFKDGKICEHWGPFARRLSDERNDASLGIEMERAHVRWVERAGSADSPVAGIFDVTRGKLADEPERTEGMTATYLFDIVGEQGGLWTLEIVDGKADVRAGPSPDPDVKVTMDQDDFIDMAEGRLEGQEAFMSGKLQVQGNMALSIRLAGIMA